MKNHTLRIKRAIIVLAMTVIRSLAQSTYEPYTFTTLAGGGGFESPDAPGSAARLSNLGGVAVDRAGNVYVADTFNHAIRKLTSTGAVTTLAGMPGAFGSADGTGIDARFYYPDRLAVDGAGNVYVSDSGNSTVRKVTPVGTNWVVTTLAGLPGKFGSADGTNGAARFNGPEGLAVDSSGNIYVADSGNSTIRKVAPAGTNWVVTTIAGLTGIIGSADGTNSRARFNFAQGLAMDGQGNLFVGDTDNYTVRKVTPVGTNWVVTTLAGKAGILGSVDGVGSAARLSDPQAVAVDSVGNIYVADEENDIIRQVAPVGTNWVVTTLAGLAQNPGSADGTGNAARFANPYGVTVDSAGNVYVADIFNDAIRKVTPVGTNWVVTTLAGLGGVPGSADGRGNEAQFKGPSGVAVDSPGNVYVADQVNHTIRKVSPGGEVTTLAGLAGYAGSANGTGSDARFYVPSGVAVDGAGNLYVIERGNGTVRKLTATGTNWTVTTLASGFGEAKGVAVDSATNIYVADSGNHTIRKATLSGSVSTLAGNAGFTGKADGIGGAARFNYPTGVAVDSATNIYVADTWNHTIRKVTPARVVTTIAGLAGSVGSVDGTGPAARFNYPSGLVVDNSNNIYVADTYNNTIRKLSPVGTNWVVTTLGGTPGFWGSTDGRGSAARFSNPNGVAVDSSGNLYVADFYLNTIRKGYAPPRILNPGFNAGQFGFSITGPPGQSVIVEASTDLVNWLPIWTNTLATGLSFSDSRSSTSSRRFYRTLMP